MTSAEHYHVEVILEDKKTGKRQTHTYNNQGKGTPGYTRAEAASLAKKISDETTQNPDVELVGITLKQMGLMAAGHLGTPTQ
jgi:hypothetical protein